MNIDMFIGVVAPLCQLYKTHASSAFMAEDESSVIFWNCCIHQKYYTVQQSRRPPFMYLTIRSTLESIQTGISTQMHSLVRSPWAEFHVYTKHLSFVRAPIKMFQLYKDDTITAQKKKIVSATRLQEPRLQTRKLSLVQVSMTTCYIIIFSGIQRYVMIRHVIRFKAWKTDNKCTNVREHC